MNTLLHRTALTALLGLTLAALAGCASDSGDYDYATHLSVGVGVGYYDGYYGYPGGYYPYPPPVVVVPPGDGRPPDGRPPGHATTLPAEVGGGRPSAQPSMPPPRPSASTRPAPSRSMSRPAPRPMPRARGR